MKNAVRIVSVLTVAAGLASAAAAQTALSVDGKWVAVMGWPAKGQPMKDTNEYLEFPGNGVVSGTVQRTWIEDMDVGPEGSLFFMPDNASRKKYPLLHKTIDLGASKELTGKFALPYAIPRDRSICGYETRVTLLLGSYYRFNVREAGGYDAAAVDAVLSKTPPKAMKCRPNDIRLTTQ